MGRGGGIVSIFCGVMFFIFRIYMMNFKKIFKRNKCLILILGFVAVVYFLKYFRYIEGIDGDGPTVDRVKIQPQVAADKLLVPQLTADNKIRVSQPVVESPPPLVAKNKNAQSESKFKKKAAGMASALHKFICGNK